MTLAASAQHHNPEQTANLPTFQTYLHFVYVNEPTGYLFCLQRAVRFFSKPLKEPNVPHKLTLKTL